MAEDYCSSWSAWRIWRHPKVALDTLIDSGFMQENLETKLQEALDSLEQYRRENTLLTEQNVELASQVEQYALRLKESEGKIEEYAGKIDGSTRAAEESSARIEQLTAKLDETAALLKTANEELAERMDVETQIREFDAKLSQVEKLKEDYENRIATLEAQLQDANMRLDRANRLATNDDLNDNPRRESNRTGDSGDSTNISMKEPDDDWLIDLPTDLV